LANEAVSSPNSEAHALTSFIADSSSGVMAIALRGLVRILVRAPLLTNAVEVETRAAAATNMIEDLIVNRVSLG